MPTQGHVWTWNSDTQKPRASFQAPQAGTPATTVESETTWGVTPAVGTSNLYARGDHTHGTPQEPQGGGTPADSVTTETSFGASSNAGAATTYSRGDHTHGTPTNPVTAHELSHNHELLHSNALDHSNSLDHSNALDHANTNDPSADQKAALAGTSGTPSGTNKYATDSDARMTNARTPTAHTHAGGDVTSQVGSAAAADAVPWSGVSNPPATYAPSSHDNGAHSTAYLAASEKAAVSGVASLNASSLVVQNCANPQTPAAHNHAATDINSGSLDGDRLPAPTTTKRGGVKATGTPSGLFLRDDDTWAAAGGGAHDLGGASHNADTLANLNAKISDADVVALAGQLGGTAASPDVRGLRESGGQLLTMAGVTDGQYLKRSGTTITSGSPGGGSSPSWWGVIHSTQNDCNPLEFTREWAMLAVAGPTPTAVTASLARGVLFRNPAAITVARIRLFGVGATTGLYKFAIYPKAVGSARGWESGAVNSAANTWLNISANLPITLAADTQYWWCVTVTSTGTTAGFRSMPAPLGANFWGASASPLGNRGLGFMECMQFAVTSGAFPATLPTIAAAAYSAGTTGTVPFALLDSVA